LLDNVGGLGKGAAGVGNVVNEDRNLILNLSNEDLKAWSVLLNTCMFG